MSKISLVTKVFDFVAENSTTLLTVGAVAGVVTTAVTSWYAAKKTKDIKEELDDDVKKSEIAKRAWPYYVAPVLIGGLTIASIITLNIEHDKKYAALLGAYTIAKADKEKISKKLKEVVGEEKADQIKESLGIKTEEKTDQKQLPKIVDDPYHKEWIIDDVTGLRIYTSQVAVESASNCFNQMIAEEQNQSLVDFYDYLGISDDMCPGVANNIKFGIGERIPTLKIEWGSKYDQNEMKTYKSFTYDFNIVDSGSGYDDRIPWGR